ESGRFQANRVVEMRQKTVGILQLINCRTLMRDQAVSINQKLILFGFAAEDRMVFEHQRLQSRTGLALKRQRSRQPADSPTNNNAVVGLAGINDVFRKRIVNTVANRVSGLKHRQSISVRRAVFPNSAIAGELVFSGFGEQLRRSRS